MGLTGAQAAHFGLRCGVANFLLILPLVLLSLTLTLRHHRLLFGSSSNNNPDKHLVQCNLSNILNNNNPRHRANFPINSNSTHQVCPWKNGSSPLLHQTAPPFPPFRLAIPQFMDNTLEHFLPHGTQRTYQRLFQQPSRLALVRSAAPFPLANFGHIFDQDWLCRNMTLSRAEPFLCAPKSVIWDLRFLLHPPLKKRGVEALIILVDSYSHVNKSLDMPPASHLVSSALAPQLTTYDFLNLATWTLVRYAHPSHFPTNEFGSHQPMVVPGRVFFPLSAPLVPSTPDTCVFLDYGRTFLCAVFPRHAEIHFVTYFQWLEFVLQLLQQDAARVINGPCDPRKTEEETSASCPPAPGVLTGEIPVTHDDNATQVIQKGSTSSWLEATDWFSPFRCPDHLFTTTERSGCTPQEFHRYQRVLGYPIVLNHSRINVQFIPRKDQDLNHSRSNAKPDSRREH
jgi:hypothetical protein